MLFRSLDSNSAPGLDGIKTSFMKRCRQFVVPIISILANLCFRTGVFSSCFKRSIVSPVHKGGDGNDVNNYRPISVLPCISKIIEKLLNKRLFNYLDKYKILSESQYGFRKGKSTQDAIINLINTIVDKKTERKVLYSVSGYQKSL